MHVCLCVHAQIVEQSADGWWTGKVDGKMGVFPASFVEMIQKPKNKEEKKRLLKLFQQGRLGAGQCETPINMYTHALHSF